MTPYEKQLIIRLLTVLFEQTARWSPSSTKYPCPFCQAMPYEEGHGDSCAWMEFLNLE